MQKTRFNPPLKVLVVEDEKELCELVAAVLTSEDIKVLRASSKNEALSLLESNPVDIVVSDVVMPEGSGIELLEQLRETITPCPVVILMTGHSEISFGEMVQKGCKAVIRKPFRRAQLLQTLLEIAATEFKNRIA